jgi:hypothetical protein
MTEMAHLITPDFGEPARQSMNANAKRKPATTSNNMTDRYSANDSMRKIAAKNVSKDTAATINTARMRERILKRRVILAKPRQEVQAAEAVRTATPGSSHQRARRLEDHVGLAGQVLLVYEAVPVDHRAIDGAGLVRADMTHGLSVAAFAETRVSGLSSPALLANAVRRWQENCSSS